jgi:nucleoside-diphosphate-sugar epimerase
LGTRVARRWLEDGHTVDAVTRSHERAGELRRLGLRPLVADILGTSRLPELAAYDTVLFAVGFDRRSPASIHDVYVGGLKNVLAAGPQPPGRFIYISSTGVYGRSEGEWIDERSPCEPMREGGQACLDAERVLADHPFAERSIVLRMAGLYGPGRIPRQQELLAGLPIAAPQFGSLNLIHIDDAVAIVLAAERVAPPGSLYVVADGHPVQRGEYIRAVAALLGAPPPQFAALDKNSPAARRARSDKRIDNSKMLRELNVALRYPSYREGLAAALEAERNQSRE